MNKFEMLRCLRASHLMHGRHRDLTVLDALADYATPSGAGIRPTSKALAARCGLDRDNVNKIIRKLVSDGALVQIVAPSRSNQAPGEYRLAVPPDVIGQLIHDSDLPERELTNFGIDLRPAQPKPSVTATEGLGQDSPPEQPCNNHLNNQSGEAAHDAPSSHLADSDLSVATTRSAVQHEGHGEDEHEEQDELSSGTSGDAVPPVAAGASKEQAKEGEVDPRRLNGRALLAHRWGEDSAARAVHLSMQCAGGLMSEELFGLLSGLDGEFADWCSDYGSRIASRAAWSEREAAGILASKLRTFDRGIWLAA